jgi:hypothetical protein
MKKIHSFLKIIILLILIQGCSSANDQETILLNLDEADQQGSFELVENAEIGRMAVQRASNESKLLWPKPAEAEPGWYRIKFHASGKFQVIADNLLEREPFIITISYPDKEEAEVQHSFAFKSDEAKTVSLNDLPKPLLNPTRVQAWQSSQPLWLDENSRIELAVRRPLLIAGNVQLEKIPREEAVTLELAGEAPYNMFTDDNPVVFRYGIHNRSEKTFRGELRFLPKDVVDGTEQVKSIPVKIKPENTKSGTQEWTPEFGAYRLTTETVNSSGKVIYSE